MGYAVIIFVVLLAASVVIAAAVMYGGAKDSQTAPLKARNNYADIKTGQAQTDLVVNATKINGTARYTSVSSSPNILNLYLTVTNNGSNVLNPSQYSIILNRSWIWINLTSNNVTPPLNTSITSSLNLAVTPPDAPMSSISLLVAAGNGIKTITPTSPILYHIDVNANSSSGTWDLNALWLPSYGEIDPIDHYTLYYSSENIYKNNVNIITTTNATTSQFIGSALCRQGCGSNSTIYVWVSAKDIHGNEGPPSNTCSTSGGGGGGVSCNCDKNITGCQQ